MHMALFGFCLWLYYYFERNGMVYQQFLYHCFTGTWAITWLPYCHQSKISVPERYGWNLPLTKHNKTQALCIVPLCFKTHFCALCSSIGWSGGSCSLCSGEPSNICVWWRQIGPEIWTDSYLPQWWGAGITHTDDYNIGALDSVVPGRCGSSLESSIFEHILWIKFMCEIALRWMPQNDFDDKPNIGSGNSLMPDGIKPLPEPILTKMITVKIWCR